MYYLLKSCSFAVLLLLFAGFTSTDSNWQTFFENEQVRIEKSPFLCSSSQNGTANNYVLLRITNKTEQKIEVSFLKETWYDGKCSNCSSSSPEHLITVTIDPLGQKTGNCDESSLRIFDNMPSGFTKRTLTHFEIKNLVSKTLN